MFGYLGPWDVIGGCQSAEQLNLPLQDVNQVEQVAVAWIPDSDFVPTVDLG